MALTFRIVIHHKPIYMSLMIPILIERERESEVNIQWFKRHAYLQNAYLQNVGTELTL